TDRTLYASGEPAVFNRGFVLALGAVVTAVLLQLIPLPRAILVAVNPSGVWLRQQFDLSIAGTAGAQALSIVPSASWLALALLVSFVVLLLGTSGLLSI